MILILTGGIGSGKSIAAEMLHEMYGFPVYSADTRVKELYNTSPGLLHLIESLVGCRLRDQDGYFVPVLLAREIFSDEEVLRKVEDLVFPVLMDDFAKWKDEHPSKVHVFESATILEKDFFRGFGDFALVMTASLEERIARAEKRDSTTKEQVKTRVENQKLMNDLSLLDQVAWLPFEVCTNDGTLADLKSKLADFIENRVLTKML